MGELENGRTGWQNVTGYKGPTDDIAPGDHTKAHAVAESLKHRARDQAESAKTQIRSFAETGKDRVAEQLDHVARALRSTGDGLRNEQETAPISQYADRIGDKIEEASRYLREHQAIDLMDEVESVARRQPLLFIGGAFAVGIAIGRFFKSTAAASFDSGGGPIDTGYGGSEPGGSGGYGSGSYGSGSIGGYGGDDGTSSFGSRGDGGGSYGTSSYGSGSTGVGGTGYSTSAMGVLGSNPTNAGSSDLGANDLGPSSYGSGIATADIQRGYPMGSDVQAGYPEPEQSVTTPLDTSPTPVSKRLPGDDDEGL